jgi:hypothetical protein
MPEHEDPKATPSREAPSKGYPSGLKRKPVAGSQTTQNHLPTSWSLYPLLPAVEPPSVAQQTTTSSSGQVQDDTPPPAAVETRAATSESIRRPSPTPDSAPLEPPPEPSTSAPKGLPQVGPDAYGDREQTERRYKKASENLSTALELPLNKWGSFEVTPLNNLDGENPFPKIRAGILKILEKREKKAKSKDFWPSCKRVVERVFKATSPFAKNFLSIASNAQSVFAVLNCG